MVKERDIPHTLAFISTMLLSGCTYLTTGETMIILICLFVCIISLIQYIDWNEVSLPRQTIYL